MCDKVNLENGGNGGNGGDSENGENDGSFPVPDCYKYQKMCNKAVDNCPHALDFAPKCYKIQNMCDKAFDI